MTLKEAKSIALLHKHNFKNSPSGATLWESEIACIVLVERIERLEAKVKNLLRDFNGK